MVFAHFGGGVIGDLDTCDVFCGLLASVARCAVLSVDYRLAPEHRFPAGLDDVLAAYRWARDNAARFGAPTGRVGHRRRLHGRQLRRRRRPGAEARRRAAAGPAAADLSGASTWPARRASMTTYADAFPLSRATMDWFMGHYMGPEDDPADPRLSPIRAAGPVRPGAGDRRHRRLRSPARPGRGLRAAPARGRACRSIYRCYDHLAHGFTAFTGVVPAADAACREIAGLVRAHSNERPTDLMRALVVERTGAGLRRLRLKDIPTPEPGPGEVRVRVRAAAVNFPDLLQTRGEYQHKPPLPFIPGLELAGEVRRAGRGRRRRFKVGDAVVGGARIGGFAEYAVIAAAAACGPSRERLSLRPGRRPTARPT